MATGLPSVLLVMRKAAPYEDETHFSLNSRAECRVFLSKRILIDTPGIQSFTTTKKFQYQRNSGYLYSRLKPLLV